MMKYKHFLSRDLSEIQSNKENLMNSISKIEPLNPFKKSFYSPLKNKQLNQSNKILQTISNEKINYQTGQISEKNQNNSIENSFSDENYYVNLPSNIHNLIFTIENSLKTQNLFNFRKNVQKLQEELISYFEFNNEEFSNEIFNEIQVNLLELLIDKKSENIKGGFFLNKFYTVKNQIFKLFLEKEINYEINDEFSDFSDEDFTIEEKETDKALDIIKKTKEIFENPEIFNNFINLLSEENSSMITIIELYEIYNKKIDEKINRIEFLSLINRLKLNKNLKDFFIEIKRKSIDFWKKTLKENSFDLNNTSFNFLDLLNEPFNKLEFTIKVIIEKISKFKEKFNENDNFLENNLKEIEALFFDMNYLLEKKVFRQIFLRSFLSNFEINRKELKIIFFLLDFKKIRKINFFDLKKVLFENENLLTEFYNENCFLNKNSNKNIDNISNNNNNKINFIKENLFEKIYKFFKENPLKFDEIKQEFILKDNLYNNTVKFFDFKKSFEKIGIFISNEEFDIIFDCFINKKKNLTIFDENLSNKNFMKFNFRINYSNFLNEINNNERICNEKQNDENNNNKFEKYSINSTLRIKNNYLEKENCKIKQELNENKKEMLFLNEKIVNLYEENLNLHKKFDLNEDLDNFKKLSMRNELEKEKKYTDYINMLQIENKLIKEKYNKEKSEWNIILEKKNKEIKDFKEKILKNFKIIN